LADDTRALWVNPAGLAVVREASIMAELVFDQPDTGNVRVTQWSVAFNTRGLSAGYQRDRLLSGSSNQLLRIGLARPFQGGAVGIDLSFYWSSTNDRAFGAGITYELLPSVATSLVLRHIGQPVVGGVKLPFTGVAGVGWSGPENIFQIAGEVLGSNRLESSGVDLSYRAGARVMIPRPLPIAAIAAVHLSSDLTADRFFVGLAVGGTRRIVAGGTFLSGAASGFDRAQITGVASNRQTPIRR
jgi:hypothetical protein